ncbi:MAG: ATP-binding protein, partial [Alphaproteobacteria bacterium]|nr:ATP-binding protein [Alphaproteobacteria bacterium]
MHNEMQLMDLVKSLKLSGILETLESRLKQARDATMSYEELLTILFQDELESLEKQALKRRIDHAKFEELKTFESFDIQRYSLNVKHAINDLMTGKFIKE